MPSAARGYRTGAFLVVRLPPEAMGDAEAKSTKPPVVVRYRRPADRRSKPQRWRDAVAELVLQADYAAWLEALPDSLREACQAATARTSRRP